MKRTLGVVIALLVSAAGCGSASKPPETTAPVKLPGTVTVNGQATLTGDKPSVTISAGDDVFAPTFLKATAGQIVSVEVKNTGEHAHTFTIDALKVDQLLAPGETKKLAFTLPAALGANFYCKFHRPTGMQGAFYYTAGTTFGAEAPEPATTATDDPYRY